MRSASAGPNSVVSAASLFVSSTRCLLRMERDISCQGGSSCPVSRLAGIVISGAWTQSYFGCPAIVPRCVLEAGAG